MKDIIKNVTKMGFLDNFGDIFYNVFNRRISLIFNVETLYFDTYCRETYLTKYTIET